MHELVDEEVFELVCTALDAGVASLVDGQLVPFAIVEDPQGRRLARFVAEPYEAAVDKARQAVAGAVDADRVLIPYDGYVTLEGARNDALLIEAQDRRRSHSVTFAFRYRPATGQGSFEAIGDPAFTGPAGPLLQGGSA